MRIALFIVILLIVTGIVAAAGDRMGHLAARRKIRFGGMRPRHVSTLIAVTTGILIAAATFILLFALSADFRDSFLRYDELKRNLAETQQQLASQQGLVDQARRQAEDAQEQADEALAEIAAIEADVSKLRGEKVELAMALGDTQLQLNETSTLLTQRESEVATAEARKRELDEEINDLGDFLKSLLVGYGEKRDVVEQWEEGDIAIPVGTYLDYLLVTPASAADLEGDLQARVDELTNQLTQLGFTLDTAIAGDTQQFIADYAYTGVDHDVVIIVSTARNVLTGGEARLSFKAQPLTPLVSAGDEIMGVLVDTTEARVSWRGEQAATLDVPVQFDQASFATFAMELGSIFNSQAAAMGFLPDLSTGIVPNPIEALAAVYDDLAGRERPFVIQFVSKSSAHALDGLAGCEIYISNWPPER